MCQFSTALASAYHLLADFEFTPYQAPAPHPWYWAFRFILIGLVIRAFFWVLKKLPKKDTPPESPDLDRAMSSHSIQSPLPVSAKRSVVTAILVLKNGQQLGPYTLDEVNRQLSAGAIMASDFAWQERLPEWVPLASIEGVVPGPAHGLRPPPPPVHTTGIRMATGDGTALPD